MVLCPVMVFRPDRQFTSIARSVIMPQVPVVRPSWTAAQIRSAKYALQQEGDFGPCSQLLASMHEDDEFPGTLQKRINATLRSEFSLTLPGETRDLTKAEEDLQTFFPQIAPDCELYAMIKDLIMLGAAVATIDWDFKHPSGYWMPRLRALPAEFLRWDEWERRYYYHDRSGEVPVEAGNGKWVLMTLGPEAHTQGLILGLAGLWFGKQMTLGDWQRYNQKHGLPIFKAKVPLHTGHKEKDEFIDGLSGMGSEGIVGLPQDEQGLGYDLELLEARDTAWESFQTAAERADRKFQVSLLGGNLGAEVTSQGANRAAAETHAASVDRDKAKSDAKNLGQSLQEQLVLPFIRTNFGPDQITPYPFWDTCPEESIRSWVTAQNQFIQTLGLARQSGYDIENYEQLGREYGFRLKKVDVPPTGGGGEGQV